MKYISRLTLATGTLIFFLTVLNATTAGEISPSFQRSEILAGMSSIILILISVLTSTVIPNKSVGKIIKGKQGLYLDPNLNETAKEELAWGSHMFLTATSAITILVYWKELVVLRRGLISSNNFIPGEICKKAKSKGEIISLVKTELFPGKVEFDSILENLAAVIIVPIGDDGWVILGGSSERCFTKSDEQWLTGWSKRLKQRLSKC